MTQDILDSLKQQYPLAEGFNESFPVVPLFIAKNQLFPVKTTFEFIKRDVEDFLKKDFELLHYTKTLRPKNTMKSFSTSYSYVAYYGKAYERNDVKEYIIVSLLMAEQDSETVILQVYHKNLLIEDLFTPFFSEPSEEEKIMPGIYLLCQHPTGGLFLQEHKFPTNSGDILLNYGEKFKKIHETITNRLKNIDGGIYLFHGEPGTGKTSYLKQLCLEIKDRTFVFIPSTLSSMLSQTSFINMLGEYPKPVIVLEDAEDLIRDREKDGRNPFIASILNLTDGILTPLTKTSIIATFNTARENIDEALLRKGRLKAEYRFGPLSADDANALFASLKIDYSTDKPMTLADIYNIYEEVSFSTPTDEFRSIGFMS